MVRLLFTSLILTSLTPARGASCGEVFTPALEHWQHQLDVARTLSPEAYRDLTPGRWLEFQPSQWVRYALHGRKGPLHIHFEGLGGQLEGFHTNPYLQSLARSGRVLIVELEGQGLREVHTRQLLEAKGYETTREISFEENTRNLQTALKAIMTQEGLSPDRLRTWSGHSFGGLTLAALASRENFDLPPGVFQFVASGVANFNHRLIRPKQNAQINLYSQMLSFWLPKTDTYTIQIGLKRLLNHPEMELFRGDLIKMESAIGLTLGAGRVDSVKWVENFPTGSHLQIFSGEKDRIVFNMLHWELAQAAHLAGHRTQTILVEGVGHHIHQEMTRAQLKTQLRMSERPDRYRGDYYWLSQRGELRELQPDQALQLYQSTSRETWLHLESSLNETFGAMGFTPRYPDHW